MRCHPERSEASAFPPPDTGHWSPVTGHHSHRPDSVFADFHFVHALEGEHQLHLILRRIGHSLLDDGAHGVGHRRVEQHRPHLHPRQIAPHFLPRLKPHRLPPAFPFCHPERSQGSAAQRRSGSYASTFHTSGFTRFAGRRPSSTATTFSAAITAMRVRVSTEAEARCGASSTLGFSTSFG